MSMYRAAIKRRINQEIARNRAEKEIPYSIGDPAPRFDLRVLRSGVERDIEPRTYFKEFDHFVSTFDKLAGSVRNSHELTLRIVLFHQLIVAIGQYPSLVPDSETAVKCLKNFSTLRAAINNNSLYSRAITNGFCVGLTQFSKTDLSNIDLTIAESVTESLKKYFLNPFDNAAPPEALLDHKMFEFQPLEEGSEWFESTQGRDLFTITSKAQMEIEDDILNMEIDQITEKYAKCIAEINELEREHVKFIGLRDHRRSTKLYKKKRRRKRKMYKFGRRMYKR